MMIIYYCAPQLTLSAGNIYRASAIGSVISVLKFVHEQVPLNEPNSEGHTPLFLAVNCNNPLCVATLLAGGANPHHVDFQV